MVQRMEEFCQKFSERLGKDIRVEWNSILRRPGAELPELLAIGVMKKDRFVFDREYPIYGSQRKFMGLLWAEEIKSARVGLSVFHGPTLYLETLL